MSTYIYTKQADFNPYRTANITPTFQMDQCETSSYRLILVKYHVYTGLLKSLRLLAAALAKQHLQIPKVRQQGGFEEPQF